MSVQEHREEMEKLRHTCNDQLRKCESSRDYWKFSAITLFFVLLFCILYLQGCLPGLN